MSDQHSEFAAGLSRVHSLSDQHSEFAADLSEVHASWYDVEASCCQFASDSQRVQCSCYCVAEAADLEIVTWSAEAAQLVSICQRLWLVAADRLVSACQRL